MARKSFMLYRAMLVVVLGWCAGIVVRAADVPANDIGKRVADFQLKNTRGESISLADYKDKKAVVVIFTGTECPINNLFMPRLAALHKEYASKGVQILAVNSNKQDTVEQIAEHAGKYEIPFPVLKDEGNRVADLFGARRTPEAFVLDSTHTIRYQGRIDDQFGIGYKRPQPTRRDLGLAIDDLLAGRPVAQATTPVAGCLIARVKDAKADGEITFAKHIAPIIQNNCQECHRPGQIGPMSLLTYRNVVNWSDSVREVIQEGRMPPWHADPRYGKFVNDRRLGDKEREMLLSWLDHGMPKGDDKDLPPPRQFVKGWTIGQPDLVLSMPKEFDVPAETPKGGIEYKYFFVETGFTEDRWVVKAEAIPGAREVVHHIIVFVVPPGETFFPGNPKTPALAGIAPGDMPLIVRPGCGKLIPARSQLVFQMHYTPNGQAQKDRSMLGLIFAKEKPAHRVWTEPIAYPPAIRIPPGDDNYRVESAFQLPQDAHVLGFLPHMHLRGKDFVYEAIYPDGKKQTLLSVPRYNFNWQTAYRLAEPLAVPKGTKIHCVAHFDNSANNPNNPDPTKRVFWGDQTWEEMMIGWMDYYYDK
jgi:peroxiredoxin